MRQTEIDKIKYLDKLPQLPQVMLKILEVCNNDETDLDELVRIISSDTGLTARLMQLLNSAWINMNKDIQSIESAVIYLGIPSIKNIAISISVVHVFDSEKSLRHFNMNTFWYHSFKCAMLAQKMARLNGSNPDEAFLAGLMHDTGKLVLMLNYPDEYIELIKKAVDDYELGNLERSSFNLTHAEVGGWLCQKWHLSPTISDAVLYLNDSIERVQHAVFPLVKILHAVNYFCSIEYSTDRLSKLADEVHDRMMALIGIDQDTLESAIVEVENDVVEMAESLGIRLPPGQISSSISGRHSLLIEADSQTDNIATELISNALQSRIKEYSLIYGTLENLLYAGDVPSVLGALEMGLKILFKVLKIFYFLCDDDNSLAGYCSNKNRKDRIVNSIAISMSNKESLLVKSLVSRQITNSLNRPEEESLAISDAQIMRLLDCELMVSIPMYLYEKNIGVIVMGAHKDITPVLIQNRAMLAMLAKLASVSLDHHRYRNDQEKLIHKERVSASSESICKMIHEINNPLLIITSYLKMLSLNLPKEHPAQKELHVIDEEIERIGGLVNGLSFLSKPAECQFEWVDVHQLFSNMLAMIRKSILIPKGIDASIFVEPDFPRVKTDKNGLKQIFINLLKNASEAMGKGGQIYIGLKQIPGSVKIMIDEKRKTSGQIEIIVRDTGPGISDEIMKRIFEPYNSSKNRTNSGLGLSIVNNIVKNINGSIECHTKKNIGTEFKIVLPISSSHGAL